MSRRVRSTSLFVVLATALGSDGSHRTRRASGRSAISRSTIVEPAHRRRCGRADHRRSVRPDGGESGFVQVHVTQTVSVCDCETEIMHEENQDLQCAEVTFVSSPRARRRSDLSVESRLHQRGRDRDVRSRGGQRQPALDRDGDDEDDRERRRDVQRTPAPHSRSPARTSHSSPTASSSRRRWGCTRVSPARIGPVRHLGCGLQGQRLQREPHAGDELGHVHHERERRDGRQPAWRWGHRQHEHRLPDPAAHLLDQHLLPRDDRHRPGVPGDSHLRGGQEEGREQRQQGHGLVRGPQDARALELHAPGHERHRPDRQAGDLYVGMAPKCPSKNAKFKAPCIVSQTGDGVGGTYIRGWLPGGDPPRRT